MARTFIEGLAGGLQSQIPNILARRRSEQEEEERKRRRRQDAFALAEGELGPEFSDAALEEQWQTGVNIDNLPAARLAGLATRIRKQNAQTIEDERRAAIAEKALQDRLRSARGKARDSESTYRSQAEAAGVIVAPSAESFEGMTVDQIDDRRREQERSSYELTSSLAAAEASKSDQQKLAQTVSDAPVLRDADMDVYRNLFPNLTPEEFKSGYDLGKNLRGLGERESASVSNLEVLIENHSQPLPEWVTNKDSSEGNSIRSNPKLAGLVASMISSGQLPNSFHELEKSAGDIDKSRGLVEANAINKTIHRYHSAITGMDDETLRKKFADTLTRQFGTVAAERFNAEIHRHTKLEPLQKDIEAGGYWSNFSSQFKHTSPTKESVSIGIRNKADVPIYVIEAVALTDGGFAYKAKPAPFNVIKRKLTDAEMNEMTREAHRLNNTTELGSSDNVYEIPVKDKNGKRTGQKIQVRVDGPR
tara:strand:+ start:211 stop:1641 length:1431 start_codon:yes stop_codon:yes gene_type:complete